MTAETEWVEELGPRIADSLSQPGIFVKVGFRLPYALSVAGYRVETVEPVAPPLLRKYETDLLIGEHINTSSDWLTRVVIESKLGDLTTHDALTYSAKAATHKNVHPYLRYGMVIGRHPGAVPGRLIRHGHQFDFMLTLPSETVSTEDLERLSQLLQDEIQASREIGRLLSEKSNVTLVHRKWITAT